MKIGTFFLLILFTLLLTPGLSLGQANVQVKEANLSSSNPPSSSTQSSKKENILNFDGDVIEGERKRPDLFLQLKSDELNIDSVIYTRPDFNDFKELEKEARPLYVK